MTKTHKLIVEFEIDFIRLTKLSRIHSHNKKFLNEYFSYLINVALEDFDSLNEDCFSEIEDEYELNFNPYFNGEILFAKNINKK